MIYTWLQFQALDRPCGTLGAGKLPGTRTGSLLLSAATPVGAFGKVPTVMTSHTVGCEGEDANDDGPTLDAPLPALALPPHLAKDPCWRLCTNRTT